MTRVTTCYAPGDTLPNGAKVYRAERGPEGEVVLALWGERWVTWLIAANGQTVRGEYAENRDLAFAGFLRRVAGRAG